MQHGPEVQEGCLETDRIIACQTRSNKIPQLQPGPDKQAIFLWKKKKRGGSFEAQVVAGRSVLLLSP